MATTTHRPVQESERIAALDVLRGFALLGIFMVNIQFFGLPFMEAVGHLTLSDATRGEVWGWAFIRTFCELKFISMFSLLFGMGLVVQLTRAQAAGRPFVGYYLRRTLLLALFGLIHALMLWYGDILFIYACVSLLLFAMCRLQAKTLLVMWAALTLISVLLITGLSGLQVLAEQMQPPPAASPSNEIANEVVEPLRGFEAISAANFDPSSENWDTGERLAYQEGPLSDALAFRSVSYAFALIGGIVGYGWHVLAMFLLGAAFIKLDFFAANHRRWHRRLFLIGVTIGLIAEFASTGIYLWLDFDIGLWILAAAGLHEFGSYALCLGYVGGMTLLANSGALRWLMHAMACIGRTALTNYLLQTIVATAVMYWWGLGWFGDVSRPNMIALVLAIYASQLMVSTLWLRVFRIGPMEWLWRSLTYLKPQPIDAFGLNIRPAFGTRQHRGYP